jgi:hemolysin activation/secretion protein
MPKLSTFFCYLCSATILLAGSIDFEGNTSIKSKDLMEIRIALGQSDGQFVLDAKGIPIALDKVMPEYLSQDAIDGILRAVTAYYQSEGFGGARADVNGRAYKEVKGGGDLVIQITERTLSKRAPSIIFEGNQSITTEELLKIRVPMVQKDGKYVPNKKGLPMEIGMLMPDYLSEEAVAAIVQEVSTYYQEEGQLAVRADITRNAYEASQSGSDLVLSLTEGVLKTARVVAMNPDQTVPEAVKLRILAAAPLEENETINGTRLDRTLGSINRHSSDYVQPVLMQNEDGELEMEYRVNLDKAWEVGYTLDNYGSERTGRYRHSVSANARRLLTAGDILDISGTYASDDEDDSLFARAEYMLPIDASAENRLRLSGYYASYSSEDIGVQLFEYEGYTSGAILGYERTLWVSDGKYLDLSAGFHLMHAEQDQSDLGIRKQAADFYLPFVGLKMSKSGIDSSWVYGAKLETNLSDVDEVELARMGRLDAESEFVLATLYGGSRWYLDPLFAAENKRIHELTLNGSAKVAVTDDRLPSNFMNVAGGHATVRGYPVAAASGDNSVTGQLDYRMHLNRFAAPEESESEFRMRPRFAGDTPPVDVAFGMFTDYGMVENIDAQSYESDDDLWSAGFGLYGDANRYVNFRIEYSWALLDVHNDAHTVDVGDGEFYFSIDISY